MKLARPIGLCFFVIAALVQMPTGASATTVSTISLPSGTWNVSVVVTEKNSPNQLAFGMTDPQEFQICPTGEGDCAAGDAHTFSGLSGGSESSDLVFYLTDQTCEGSFSSTDISHAHIDQSDSTHWTIAWDDAGPLVDTGDGFSCLGPDSTFTDLIASVVAWQPGTTADFAAGNYDGVNELVISTVFGPNDTMRSEIIVPPSTGPDGYQAGPVTDQEVSAKDPAYITFCAGKKCDAQVDVSTLPGGSQANTLSDPGLPIKVILYFIKDDASKGDGIYAQGDGDTTSRLLANCDSPDVATVSGIVGKCVASITTTKGNDKTKTVVVLVPSGNDPIIGKR